MKERKRHISFGLPGRLSINGFGGEDSGIVPARVPSFLLLTSVLTLLIVTACILVRPGFAEGIRTWPIWVWPAFGVLSALASIGRRTRHFAALIALLWIVFAFFFNQQQREPSDAGRDLAASAARRK